MTLDLTKQDFTEYGERAFQIGCVTRPCNWKSACTLSYTTCLALVGERAHDGVVLEVRRADRRNSLLELKFIFNISFIIFNDVSSDLTLSKSLILNYS